MICPASGTRIFGSPLASLTLASGGVLAQQTRPASATNPTMNQMQSATQTMGQDMNASTQAGSPDQTYAAMMARQHQGAADMPRIAVRGIKDADLRRVAENTISENEESEEAARLEAAA